MTVSAASVPSRSRRWGAEEQQGQRHLGGVEQQVGQLAAACRRRRRGSAPRRRGWRFPRRARCARRGAAGWRWTPRGRPAAAPAWSRCPAPASGARRGRWRRRFRIRGCRRGRARTRARERRGDQRVRRERALLATGEVEHAGERAQLGHGGQARQRAGRVEQGDLYTAPGVEVAKRAKQGGLATAGLGDHDGQAGAFPYLHGEVGVEEDRPAAGAGGAADQVAAAVTDGGRGLGQGGGEQANRHAPQVAGVGDGFAGDELAGQLVLLLGVLQRDAQLAAVGRGDGAGAFEAFLAGAAADGDAVPAVGAGRVDGQAGGHLVAHHQGAAGQPFQLGRGVHAVFEVVLLLRADHPEPVFEIAEAVLRGRGCRPVTKAPSARACARGSAARARAARGCPAAPCGRRSGRRRAALRWSCG